jgi:hypothetical protein
MPRQDNSLLPDSQELSRILYTEATRNIPEENRDIHFPDFSSFKNLLVHFNIPTNILDHDDYDIHRVVLEGSTLLDNLVPQILVGITNKIAPLLDEMYDYLSEEDLPKKSDIIFIFGSQTPLRAKKAAAIYHQKLANKIVISGGKPIYYAGNPETEALRYKEILINAGIPKDVIITEDASITIADNVRSSLNLLDQQALLPDSIIIVNSPYVQRRGWAVMKKHLPSNVAIYRVNSECADAYNKESWYKQEKTLRVVLNEFIKMRASVVYNTA